MAGEHRIRGRRLVVLGVAAVAALSFVGVGVAEAVSQPSTLRTCMNKGGSIRVKPKGCSRVQVTQTWVDSRYWTYLQEKTANTGNVDYGGMFFAGITDNSDAHSNNDNFTGANFSGASLVGTEFHLDNLSGVNFTNADLLNASFTDSQMANVVWSNTTCPDGTNSNSDGGTCLGRGGSL